MSWKLDSTYVISGDTIRVIAIGSGDVVPAKTIKVKVSKKLEKFDHYEDANGNKVVHDDRLVMLNGKIVGGVGATTCTQEEYNAVKAEIARLRQGG